MEKVNTALYVGTTLELNLTPIKINITAKNSDLKKWDKTVLIYTSDKRMLATNHAYIT